MKSEWWWPEDTREWVFSPRAIERIRQAILRYGAQPNDPAILGLVPVIEQAIANGQLQIGFRSPGEEQVGSVPRAMLSASPLNRASLVSGSFRDEKGKAYLVFFGSFFLEPFVTKVRSVVPELLHSTPAPSGAKSHSENQLEFDYANRRTWKKASDSETRDELLAFLQEGNTLSNTEADRERLEKRLGKRVDRDYFRALRQELSPAALGPGPRRTKSAG
jgi:hypothetical protein